MTSILIVGVGGQGTLLASQIIGRAAVCGERDVKVSEVHGMAQRGGSVVTYVRIGAPGEQVFSPLIEEGGADIMLAFEPLEAVRWQSMINPDTGVAYVNTQRIPPMSVAAGTEQYPDDVERRILSGFPRPLMIDAMALAREAGNIRTVNTVLIGALSAHTDIDEDVWRDAIGSTVKPAFRDVNEKAFTLGRRQARDIL